MTPSMRERIKSLMTEAHTYEPASVGITSTKTYVFVSCVNFKKEELFILKIDKQLATHLHQRLEKELRQ